MSDYPEYAACDLRKDRRSLRSLAVVLFRFAGVSWCRTPAALAQV